MSAIGNGIDRRDALRMLAALGLGALPSVTRAEEIVPYVEQPETLVPGRPEHYATTLCSDGFGLGAVIETHEGRPTKVEGNPDHPASRGATDAVMQAAARELFDPGRAQVPLRRGQPAGHAAFLGDAAAWRSGAGDGAGTALLLDPTTSPTLKRLVDRLRSQYPALRVHSHAPLRGFAMERATEALAGRRLCAVPRISRAAVILSLGDDLLAEGPGRLAAARDFAAARRVRGHGDGMSRLWAIETTPTLTGAAADHRRAIRPSALPAAAAAVAAALRGESVAEDGPLPARWIARVAEDLRRAGRSALVLAGDRADPSVAAATLEMNRQLGAFGHTLDLIEPPDLAATDGGLAELCEAIRGGAITTVLSLADDPVGTAPGALDAEEAFGLVDRFWHWSLFANRSSRLADWHLPAAHELECWGDLSAFDGTASLVQPMIRPLYQGLSAIELLSILSGDLMPDALAILRESWDIDDRSWAESLKRGTLAGNAATPVALPRLDGSLKVPPPGQGVELHMVPDPWLGDGRRANLAWLQELPRPLTKLTWGNAALLSPAGADRLGISDGDVLRIEAGGRFIETPAMVMATHPDGAITLTLGHGRALPDSVAAENEGTDAFPLLRPDGFVIPATVMATGARQRLLTTQHHDRMEGRDIVRQATLAAFRATRSASEGEPEPQRSLYPDWDNPEEAWGMSIDLGACIGCMACVSACQAENNIPTVGPDEVARGHEMHWLRVDRYEEGAGDGLRTLLQPVPCMHCEKAPCEVVCPVNATVHTSDGLNAQVYNRCIGTRYCSQNCPYKVRRFNFRAYNDFTLPAGPEAEPRNPDVTVRERGVMEKCTYCIQRISAARIAADIAEGPIADGAVVTACQQACPTQAISFGDLNDPASAVNAEKAAPHSYTLLAELNTRPRTTYLARITNPMDDADD